MSLAVNDVHVLVGSFLLRKMEGAVDQMLSDSFGPLRSGGKSSKIDMLISLLTEEQSVDFMGMASDPKFQGVLALFPSQLMSGSLKKEAEVVVFSDEIVQISKKNKAQKGFFVITNRAVYVLDSSKRLNTRSKVGHITSVTLSDDGDDILLHLKAKDDCWISCIRRALIIQTLSDLYELSSGIELEGQILSRSEFSDAMETTASRRRNSEQSSEECLGSLSKAKGKLRSYASLQPTSLSNKIRAFVSKKKKRFKEDGFDLDLTYISEQIIGMGFPSDDFEGFFRNPFDEVYRFFETYHKGVYKVYNLCSERNYDPSKFHGRVACFPFDDHNCPTLHRILDFCKNVHSWLSSDPKRVVAVHCKAGKGRTGLMIACYLIYSGKCSNAKEALALFGTQRTKDGKGVTIPSQQRYVHYFAEFIGEHAMDKRKEVLYRTGPPVVLWMVRFSDVPHFDASKGCVPFFKILNQEGVKLYDSRRVTSARKYKRGFTSTVVEIPCAARVRGSIKIVFMHEDPYTFEVSMFHCWIETAFIKENRLKMDKQELDKLHKDVTHKRTPPEFTVELLFRNDDIAPVDEVPDFHTISMTDPTDKWDAGRLIARIENLEVQIQTAKQRALELESQRDDLVEQNNSINIEKTHLTYVLQGSWI